MIRVSIAVGLIGALGFVAASSFLSAVGGTSRTPLPRTQPAAGTPKSTPLVRRTAKLVPKIGTLLGAFVSSTGTGWSTASVTERETQLHRKFDIDHRFHNWTTAFPTLADRWDVQNGRIPMVTWQPDTTRLDTIIAGTSDSLLRDRAQAVAAFKYPIFLRFAHEMNANWYPWDGVRNNTAGRHDGPSKYVAAWRHVHDVFVAAGATNAVGVWCPNQVSIPRVAWNGAERYYPGDTYVDWVCVDGYNRSTKKPVSFQSIVDPIVTEYGTRKPIMIGETSSREGPTAESKGNWISDARKIMKRSIPSIAAFVWFDAAKHGNDWRINSSAASQAAFAALAHDPYFNPTAGP